MFPSCFYDIVLFLSIGILEYYHYRNCWVHVHQFSLHRRVKSRPRGKDAFEKVTQWFAGELGLEPGQMTSNHYIPITRSRQMKLLAFCAVWLLLLCLFPWVTLTFTIYISWNPLKLSPGGADCSITFHSLMFYLIYYSSSSKGNFF